MDYEIIEDTDLDDIVLESNPKKSEEANSRNYIDNEKFSIELGAWAKIAREHLERGERYQMSNYLGHCIQMIAQNVSLKHNYVGYSFRDEMVSDAIVGCIRYLHNFNYEKVVAAGKKPNAFAYVTQLVNNHFGKRILDERKEQYIKLKSYELYGGSDAFGVDDDTIESNDCSNDILSDYQSRIAEYEAFVEARKNKGKVAAEEEEFIDPLQGFFE